MEEVAARAKKVSGHITEERRVKAGPKKQAREKDDMHEGWMRRQYDRQNIASGYIRIARI